MAPGSRPENVQSVSKSWTSRIARRRLKPAPRDKNQRLGRGPEGPRYPNGALSTAGERRASSNHIRTRVVGRYEGCAMPGITIDAAFVVLLLRRHRGCGSWLRAVLDTSEAWWPTVSCVSGMQ